MSESLEEERLRIQRQIEQLERSLSGAHNDLVLSGDSSSDDDDDDDNEDDDELEEEPVNDAVSLAEQRLQVEREIQQLESALGQDTIILSDEDDDSDESGSDVDLPMNTESCLQMNMVYQQILQEKLQQLESLLQDNRLQQRELEAQLSGPIRAEAPRSNSQQPAKLFLGRFLKPYFKDKLTGLGPPANPESKEKARNMTQYLDHKRMKLKRWEGWQKTLLIHAVSEDRMKRLIKPKLNKIDYLTQKLSSSQKEDTKLSLSQQEDITQQIDQLEKDILTLKAQNEEELVGDRYDNHDWEKISNIDFEGTREAQDICRFWQNVLHPSIDKTRWSQEEIDRLEELIKKHQERDWDKIAEELGTHRTAFMCLQMHQRYISKTFKNNMWTEEEDQALIELVEKMRMGNFIPYTQMSYFMEGREPVQLMYRWNGVLDPSLRKGQWIPEEDELLIQAVSRYGEKNWWRIKMEVPGRTDGACRDRYYDCLKAGTKRGAFDENERRLLLMLVQKHGVGRWSKIAAEIPNRFDAQCMREWWKFNGKAPGAKRVRKKRSNEAGQRAAPTTRRKRRAADEAGQQAAPTTRRKRRADDEAGQQAGPAPRARRRRPAAKTAGKRRRKRIKKESEEEEEVSLEESEEDDTQVVYMDDSDEDDKKAVIKKVEERRGGDEAQTEERRGGEEAAQTEERRGGEEAAQTEERRGGEEAQTEERRGGEEAQTEERRGGEEAQTEERRGGEEAQTEERRVGEEAAQTEESMGGEEAQTEESMGREEAQTEESMGGEAVQTEESMGGEEAQTEESMGGEEAQTEESMGREEAQTEESMGGEAVQTEESMGGEEAQTEESMGGEEAQTEERRGVEKAVQTEERREVEKEVTAVQTVQRAKKEHPLPPMEEWLPRTRVKKIDALNGRLVERPEPCSSSSSSSCTTTTTTTTTSSSSAPPPPPQKRPPSGVRCTIVTPRGVPVDSLFGQVPKALPRWQRHQPKALIQVSCPHLNSLMQRKASSVPTSRAPTRGVDLVMEFRLMAAVTPWIGHLLLPPPRTRRRSSTDRLRQRGEELHLSSTSVFLLLLKTLRVDLTGCMGAIEQRTGGNRSASPRADSLCALSPKREPSPKMTISESEMLSFIRLTKPRQHVQQLVVQQQPLLQQHKQQRVKYLLQQERQQKQQQQLVQAHTSRQQEVTPSQPRPQSPQPHHLQLVLTQQPKKSNTPPPVSPWMIPHPVPPHILMPIPPNMLLQYLPLMRPAVLRAQMPPLPFPLRSVPQTCHPLAVSMSSATPISMSSSGPVSMSTNTPVTLSNTPVSMSSHTPVTMSDTPVSKSSNTPVFVSTSTPVTMSNTPVSMPSHTPVTMSNTPVSMPSHTLVTMSNTPVSMPSHTPVTMSNTPVSMPSHTPVTMSNTPVSMPSHTPVTMSNTPVSMPSHTPVTMSNTPVTMCSNAPVSMPSPNAVQAAPLPHNPSAIPPSLPDSSSISRASAPTVPGQPSVSSETTSQCHSHASSPAEEKPSGKRDRPDGMITSPGEACESGKRQRKLTEKVKLLQDDAIAKVEAKEKKMVTPKRKKLKIVPHAPDMLPKGQSLWKMTVDGLVQVTAGDELPPGLKLPLPPIGGRPTPPRNVVFQQLIPFPNSSTNKIQASPRSQASPTSVPPRSASSPLLPALLPGINHPGLLVFPGVLPPPGTSSPGPSGFSLQLRPTAPTTSVRPQAVSSSSSSLPVGSRPAFHDHRVWHQTSGSPRGPPPPGPSPGPTALPTGSPFQPRLPPSLSQPRPPAGPPSFTLLHPGPPSLPRLPSPPISSVRVPFKGTANTAAAPGTPPRTPPLLRIEPTQLDPSLMFTEPVAEVQRWMSGCRGVEVPGSDLALPYLPPFISNLRTLCALLKAKRSLVDRALQSEPVGDSKPSSPRPGLPSPATTPGRFPDHDYIQTSHPEEDERVAAVRHLVAQRFAANPAYQLLKARFLSCFTVPALLATVEPIIHLPDSCTANEEEEEEEAEEELRVLGAEEELRAGEAEELRVGEAEEELRGGEAEEELRGGEEELRGGEEENVGSENPLLLMRGSPAAHYSGMTTRLTSRLLATEPPQTGPMDTGPEQ